MPHDFTPKIQLSGFDKDATPPWQMVPLNGTRQLTIAGAGKGTIVACDEEWICQTSSKSIGSKTYLTLKGKRKGVTLVEFIPPSGPSFSLAVSVKNPIQIRTSFFYVKDRFGHETSRNRAELSGLIARANAILTPQANVEVIRKKVEILTMSRNVNLGDVVRKLPRGSRENVNENEYDDLKAMRDRAADLTVFFVHEWERDNTPLVDDVVATSFARRKMSVMQDQMNSDHVTLAHEIGHILGFNKRNGHLHPRKINYLMTSGSRRTGTFIPMEHANILNT